ncbi:hypothetical protein, conserved [Trypanosoma cruzi]|uniref:Uncharacterized protein n=1 Tax=Trypanosoma cruzi (strain CL Brener) TaxID=353153 RepID=Q4DUQ1_TRYCC|nr:hypothetical protein, conserved [Trypanosoma cruzi]EAN96261.1 hypothetical protein, conserved [Trypanosoma cruzi]|eukprot:XP_818112.1 hypothetical protein [Trypanosoma cruzi strain CL Brener]
MHTTEVESVPRRNPFKNQWRTNLPSFHDCLASLGSRENFRSFGEVLAAVSPPPREIFGSPCALNSPKMNAKLDFSFFTLELSDTTLPGTPPHPVERYQQSCASSTERTPRISDEEEQGEGISLTPRQLPPLCPNASPIAHSPSAVGGSCSAPRTEPQEVWLTHSVERAHPALLKEGGNLETLLVMENSPASIDHCARCGGVTPLISGGDFFSGNDNGVGQWGCINQRVNSIIPPLCEWSDGKWLRDPINCYGDFAYHHPLIYRVSAGAARDDVIREMRFL